MDQLFLAILFQYCFPICDILTFPGTDVGDGISAQSSMCCCRRFIANVSLGVLWMVWRWGRLLYVFSLCAFLSSCYSPY